VEDLVIRFWVCVLSGFNKNFNKNTIFPLTPILDCGLSFTALILEERGDAGNKRLLNDF
jgi:hypothetical protein